MESHHRSFKMGFDIYSSSMRNQKHFSALSVLDGNLDIQLNLSEKVQICNANFFSMFENFFKNSKGALPQDRLGRI